jgi:hypothetical protein
MVQKREAYAPWSLTRKAGVQSATVNGDIEVPQFIQPVLDTGFVDENGNWKGVKSSDEQFTIDAVHESVANGASVLSPQATPDYIDMTGFNDLSIAFRVTDTGNYTIAAVMGPATNSYANLSPVNAGDGLKVAYDGDGTDAALLDCFYDPSEAMTANVWQVFIIHGRTRNQKLLQFMITNNSGGASNIEFAYLRSV